MLDDITATGRQIGAKINSYKKELNDIEARIETNKKEADRLNVTIASDTDKLNAMPLVAARHVVPTDIKGWRDLESKIQAISATIGNCDTTMDNGELTAQKSGLVAKRDAVVRDLNKQDEIRRLTKEVERLDMQSRDLAQQIADIEHDELVIAEFSKKKIEDCETRINGMFKFVRFRLFDHTIEGNEVETCVPLVNGVPWNTANDAGKVNAGLDIINTLIHFYNVCAPIFIDRKESINKPMDMDAQVIYLKVTDDKELKVY